MRIRVVLLLFILLVPFSGQARKTYFDFRYDSRTGEFTLVIPSSGRSYDGYGYNLRTGQMWFNQITPLGARGVDPYGDYWIFDRRSGAYLNTNGMRCMGNGVYRRCIMGNTAR